MTISLPASRRTSRNPSVDRERRPSRTSATAALRLRSSSVEIFNGVYQMRVTEEANENSAAAVTEVSSNFVSASTDADSDAQNNNVESSTASGEEKVEISSDVTDCIEKQKSESLQQSARITSRKTSRTGSKRASRTASKDRKEKTVRLRLAFSPQLSKKF